MRIEPWIAEDAGARVVYEELEDALVARLEAAVAEGAIAFKSVIAYRTGLDITQPSAADARSAFTRWREDDFRESRLHAKPVRDRLLERTLEVATASGVPVHIHSGGGDPDSLVAHARPAGLFDLLKRHPHQPVLLIHAGWPWTDEAAFLASILPHVYLDLSIGIPWASLAIDRLIETALGVAPPAKVLYGSDEASEPEVVWFSALVAREALARVLGRAVEHRWLDAAQARVDRRATSSRATAAACTGSPGERDSRGAARPARRRPTAALALVEPASGERTTYGELRATAERLARSLAAAGVEPGRRRRVRLPNGPEIIARSSASSPRAPRPRRSTRPTPATSSAPTSRTCGRARCSSCAARRARRAPPARRSASAPLELAGASTAALAHRRRRAATGDAAAARPRRRRAAAAHERHDEQAQGRAAPPAQPRRLGARDRRHLRALGRRREPLRDAALPRARPRRLDARDARLGRHA